MTKILPIRLGVNIDHIATIRNARGGDHPDVLRAAEMAVQAGADGITAHLREDRRHIRDEDIAALKAKLNVPLNLEMALTEEMIGIALRVKPHAVCLVPEKRQERTTEGGLDLVNPTAETSKNVMRLLDAGIRVSAFIEPSIPQIDAARSLHIKVVEIHTGRYAKSANELPNIQDAAKYAAHLGIECHAGHGLNYENVPAIAAIPQIVELNIGHFLVGEAAFIGLAAAVRHMRFVMDNARAAISVGAA